MCGVVSTGVIAVITAIGKGVAAVAIAAYTAVGAVVTAVGTALAGIGEFALGALGLTAPSGTGIAAVGAVEAGTGAVATTAATTAGTAGTVSAVGTLSTGLQIAGAATSLVGLFMDGEEAPVDERSESDYNRGYRLQSGWLNERWKLENHGISPLNQSQDVAEVNATDEEIAASVPTGLIVGASGGVQA